jgi:hypothetical protein
LQAAKNGGGYEITTKQVFFSYSYSSTWVAALHIHNIKTFKNTTPKLKRYNGTRDRKRRSQLSHPLML